MAAYRLVYDYVTCRMTAPKTAISSGTLHSVIEYGLPLPFYCSKSVQPVPKAESTMYTADVHLLVRGLSSACPRRRTVILPTRACNRTRHPATHATCMCPVNYYYYYYTRLTASIPGQSV